MSGIDEDSDRRCPYDGKKMRVWIGQDAADVGGHGWVEMWHYCLSCDYRERDNQWKRTPVVELVRAKRPTLSGMTAAQRLKALRDGSWEIPLQLDVPAGTFQEVLDGQT